MTSDHLFTALALGGYCLAIWIALAAITMLYPGISKSARGRSLRRSAFFIAMAIAFAVSYYDNMGVASEKYPDLLEAYQRAAEDRRPAMRAVVAQAARRRETFSFSLGQRDRYLLAGGYCASIFQADCRPVPRGSEAEGVALERFAYITVNGTTAPSPLACNSSQRPC